MGTICKFRHPVITVWVPIMCQPWCWLPGLCAFLLDWADVKREGQMLWGSILTPASVDLRIPGRQGVSLPGLEPGLRRHSGTAALDDTGRGFGRGVGLNSSSKAEMGWGAFYRGSVERTQFCLLTVLHSLLLCDHVHILCLLGARWEMHELL